MRKTVCVDMPKQLHDAVDRRAKALGIKRSMLFREAIIEGLNAAEKRIKAEQKRIPE